MKLVTTENRAQELCELEYKLLSTFDSVLVSLFGIKG